MFVVPRFPRVLDGFISLLRRPAGFLSGTTRFDGIWRAKRDIGTPSVCLPPGNLVREFLVRKHNPLVMFLFKAVVEGFGVRRAPHPKLFYELVPLLVCSQKKKGATFLRRNKIGDILRQPKSSRFRKTCNSLVQTLLACRTARCVKARRSPFWFVDLLRFRGRFCGPLILRHTEITQKRAGRKRTG